MDDCIIQPCRSQNDPLLPPDGILAVNPTDAAVLPKLAQTFALVRSSLFHSSLYSGSNFFLAGPAVGAPMAVMTAEKLIALGARRILLYGWCGSLVQHIPAGALCIPTGAVSEEGTSSHYIAKASFLADRDFVDTLYHYAQTTGLPVHRTVIWTTDAPYRETRKKITAYAAQKVSVVDMESSALYALAAYRKIVCGAVLYVSDELYHHTWEPRFIKKSFRRESCRLLEQLCFWVSKTSGVCR